MVSIISKHVLKYYLLLLSVLCVTQITKAHSSCCHDYVEEEDELLHGDDSDKSTQNGGLYPVLAGQFEELLTWLVLGILISCIFEQVYSFDTHGLLGMENFFTFTSHSKLVACVTGAALGLVNPFSLFHSIL